MPAHRPQTPVASTSDPSSGGILGGVIANRGFVACTVLLVAFAAGFHFLTVQKNIRFRKLAAPLKLPLDQLDHKKLGPYQFLRARTIEPQILDALGTKEYIEWELLDTSITHSALPVKLVRVFLTYYTGMPDQVPHVPEECYKGGGYRQVGDQLEYARVPGVDQDIPLKVVEFEGSSLLRRQNHIVLYTFNTNGRFCSNRRCVQLAINDPRSNYAYFSKMELTFGQGDALPTRKEAIDAGKKFLKVLIPVLLEDHWPDWEDLKKPENTERNAL